ncbi:hypothetical protein ACOSP7_031320 [Xanthoceras sorbifolium]
MHRDMTFMGLLVHDLLLREIRNDGSYDMMRFRLGQHTAQLSRVEFHLIRGLKFGELPNTSLYCEVVEGIHCKYFNLRGDVTCDNVKDALELGRFGALDDALKLSLILLLYKFLYGSDDRDMLPVWVLRFVDDLEAFGAFPWNFSYTHIRFYLT